MIQVTKLSKSYAEVEALRGVDLQVDSGEIVGLLGPNGAGKTTLIKILTGYLQPDEGTVIVNGCDVLTQPKLAQKAIGYLPENAPLYPELTVQSYLRLIAQLRDVPRERLAERISAAVRATQLEDQLVRPVGQLSKGFRQRVGLAQAILHRPALLILDEPTVGLDPTQIQQIRKLLKQLSAHSTILFSTHILPEVEALCDRAVIIINGRIRSDARLADLATYADVIISFTSPPEPEVAGLLSRLPGAPTVEAGTGRHPFLRVSGAAGIDLCPLVFQAARSHGWPVREIRSDARTLETVFNELAEAPEEVAP